MLWQPEQTNIDELGKKQEVGKGVEICWDSVRGRLDPGIAGLFSFFD